MPAADNALALPLTLNPNIQMTYQQNCLLTIETGVRQLLVDANGGLPLEKINIRVSYLSLFESESHYQEKHLSLSIGISNRELCDTLARLLNNYFHNENQPDENQIYLDTAVLSKNPRAITKKNKAEPIVACVVIPHLHIPRFLNEILRGVMLYSHHDYSYSLVRDFYLVGPEGKRAKVKFDEELKLRELLNAKYNELHQVYNLSQKMQTRIMALAHRGNGAEVGVSLFKKINHSASSQEELYQRLNALVHAYHLGEVGSRVDGFIDKISAKDERARITETTEDGLLKFIHHGDMFYEVSKLLKDKPDLNLAFVSPDNLFRAGSAALVGGKGSLEESIARVSNYIPCVLAQAELHPSDPQAVLCSLYSHLQPTGLSLTLGKACGVYHLEGQTIPEYIARENVKAVSEFAYNALHLAREMATEENDKYPSYKTTPHLTPRVKFLDAQGVVRSVSVVGMVGIDGRCRRPGSFADQVAFADSDLQDQHGFNQNHAFDLDKAKTFYAAQWMASFDAVLASDVQVFVLNPVGCGAFDPSDGSQFTEASAQGFAVAFSEKKDRLRQKGIQLIFPVYDMEKVYERYSQALNDVQLQPNRTDCEGGTPESCCAIIAKKYRELNGKKFDIENKTLPEILAHALQKPRKTREALIALRYCSMDAHGQLALNGYAPQPVQEAYNALTQNQEAVACIKIKELIVEAYKKQHGRQLDLGNKTLAGIIAHALEKRGKTLAALMALDYLQLNDQGEIVLCPGDVPAPVRQAHAEAQDQASPVRVKDRIIEAYKKTQGLFARNHQAAGGFNIYSATLEAIFGHAKAHNDEVRRVLINLGYVKIEPAVDVLQLTETYRRALQGVPNQLRVPSVVVKAKIVEAYNNQRGIFYKDSAERRAVFDMATATLEEIVAHAEAKDGNTRRAMLALGYMAFQRRDEALVLNPDCGLGCVQAVFNPPQPPALQP
ncbi:MAG TPA: hypothetical protein VFU82_00510 [Gammaproteobacteria bacterium]|nr:hypothetical protein [Gammaproteobacteria bacterium]